MVGIKEIFCLIQVVCQHFKQHIGPTFLGNTSNSTVFVGRNHVDSCCKIQKWLEIDKLNGTQFETIAISLEYKPL